ncbi:MAG: beta-ketoacyl-[acyl-carrier-protein] synthase family protein [Deltaproteobacteria bacterium]|nr:beta-ketoacyl-[acyl-carrier-protein] synthase family protein [Deltaproteobacteria bacterium]
MSRRVFITGYGVISAIGRNAAENYQSLIQKKSGFGRLDVLTTVHRDTIFACEVKQTDHNLCDMAGVSISEGYTRTALLALIALREAIGSASLTENDVSDCGFISATTAGGIRELETHYDDLQNPQKTGDFLAYLDTADPGEHTERLADLFQMRRYIGTVSTACSSSTNAIMLGARLIANRVVDRIICGGSEALSKVTINGFNTLMILDKGHCRPFDENRNGLNLGEGAAYLVLESDEILKQSRRSGIAELRGYANVNDAFHQTASSPDGAGAYTAMEQALAMSGLGVADIDYINAHGTGTGNNDLAEGLAIKTLFGHQPPPFSSTKPYTGHTTSAAGGVEAVFCMMALQHDTLFPNLNFMEPMKEVGIKPVTEVRQQAGLKNILSNSFGFGGGATTLLFSKCL